MFKIWVRDSFRAKWRLLKTKDFKECWDAESWIDKSLDLGDTGEAVALMDGETPYSFKEVKGR